MTAAYKQGYEEVMKSLRDKQRAGEITAGYVATLRTIAVSCQRNASMEEDSRTYHYYLGQIAAIDQFYADSLEYEEQTP